MGANAAMTDDVVFLHASRFVCGSAVSARGGAEEMNGESAHEAATLGEMSCEERCV